MSPRKPKKVTPPGKQSRIAGPEVKVITMKDIQRCPVLSLSAGHYRKDGSCRCEEIAALP